MVTTTKCGWAILKKSCVGHMEKFREYFFACDFNSREKENKKWVQG